MHCKNLDFICRLSIKQKKKKKETKKKIKSYIGVCV